MQYLINSFTSMSIDDIDAAKDFYGNTLGLAVTENKSYGILTVDCGGGTSCMLYHKDDHQPATHTTLNLRVTSVEQAVDDLSSRGVTINHDEGTDEKGIMTMDTTKMAWFNDPAGNFISLIESASPTQPF